MLARSFRVVAFLHQPNKYFPRSVRMTSMPIDNKPMEKSIREKLIQRFSPEHLDITNESYMHNVPKGSETHFKVVVVSEKFENTSLLQVYSL